MPQKYSVNKTDVSPSFQSGSQPLGHGAGQLKAHTEAPHKPRPPLSLLGEGSSVAASPTASCSTPYTHTHTHTHTEFSSFSSLGRTVQANGSQSHPCLLPQACF